MDIRQSLLSFGTMTVAAIAACLLFRRNPRQNIISRGPLFIICFLVFFYFGFVNLPLALPDAFERVLGHSVWMNYMPPPRINVTQEGGTWWVVRWLDPIRQSYFFMLLVGIAWAVVNLVRRRAWKVNLACLGIGTLLILGSLILSVACFPFCF